MERCDRSGDPEAAHDHLEQTYNEISRIIEFDSWVDETFDVDEENEYLRKNFPHIYDQFKESGKL